jgi:hypothetical protein
MLTDKFPSAMSRELIFGACPETFGTRKICYTEVKIIQLFYLSSIL